MAIKIEEFKKIASRMPKATRGDEMELTEEDEAALDRAWNTLRRKSESIADRETDEPENNTAK